VSEADELIERLGLGPLPLEGGWWCQTHIDEHSTGIYYLLRTGEFSHLHRLPGPELYHWYAGSPLQLLILYPDGTVDEPVLGPDLATGQRPQITVPGNTWQGSSSTGQFTLAGTTMAPPYRQADFELGERAALAEAYPAAGIRIEELTNP